MKNKIKEMLKSDMYLTMDIVGQLNSLNGSFETYVLYNMEDFDEMMEGYTPTELAERIFFGDFNINDDYFGFDSYANLESITEYEIQDHFEPIIDEIVDSMLYHYTDLYIDNEGLDNLVNEYLEKMK